MIRVFLYPPFSSLAGRKELELAGRPGLTVGAVLEELARAHPALAGRLTSGEALCIVKARIVGVDWTVEDGEEISVMPLAAGG